MRQRSGDPTTGGTVGWTLSLPRAATAPPVPRVRRRAVDLRLPGWFNRALLWDVAAILVSAADVWLRQVEDPGAPAYSSWMSWLSVAALVLRRRFPFVAVLIAVPGFFVGWAQLAAMIALGTVARRYLLTWRTVVAGVLVALCRFVLWPWGDFLALNWREHLLDFIYGCLVAGMPIAIGMLITVRADLFARIGDLARSRERERHLHAETVRAAERATLAREMHDIVSHQVTLIAMRAGALRVAAKDDESRAAAETIRALSTKTLEEMRELVGVLRSTPDDGLGVENIADLVHGTKVRLAVDVCPEQLPVPVSRAAYRTVQEALTNVSKHAPGATATVSVNRRDTELTVEIRNTSPDHTNPDLPSGGYGLIGLRERATLLGGTFAAGPTPDGGFTVHARYPL